MYEQFVKINIAQSFGNMNIPVSQNCKLQVNYFFQSPSTAISLKGIKSPLHPQKCVIGLIGKSSVHESNIIDRSENWSGLVLNVAVCCSFFQSDFNGGVPLYWPKTTQFTWYVWYDLFPSIAKEEHHIRCIHIVTWQSIWEKRFYNLIMYRYLLLKIWHAKST